MSNETEPLLVSTAEDTAAQIIPPATAGEDDMKLVEEAVRSLPTDAAKDLLSNGVCIICIFRLLGIQEHMRFASPLLPWMCNMLGEPVEGYESMKDWCTSKESEVCSVCLGILQWIHYDDKGVLVRKENALNLCASIVESIKQQGHQIDNFSLEVSIPSIIQENENVVR